ncbi:MAG: hypothetical protein NTW21_19925 [Verrucomicrobia bacterium]|nr:hypothetical protein [Verrucomicrobiota bacterium]
MKLLLISLFFLLPAAAFAQEKAPKHTCRVLFFDGPEAAPEKLQLFDGATCREVDLPRMNFSKVYQLPAGPLNLRLLPDPPTDPAKIPVGAPSVAVAEDVIDFYLLVTSDPANPVSPVRMQVINAGSDKLKLGQMLWFNLTKNPVGGMVGSEKLVIQPNSRAILDPPASGHRDYPVNLSFRIPGNEHLYPLCETKWRHDPRSRSVVFINADPASRSPRVMVFPDYREAPPAKP